MTRRACRYWIDSRAAERYQTDISREPPTSSSFIRFDRTHTRALPTRPHHHTRRLVALLLSTTNNLPALQAVSYTRSKPEKQSPLSACAAVHHLKIHSQNRYGTPPICLPFYASLSRVSHQNLAHDSSLHASVSFHRRHRAEKTFLVRFLLVIRSFVDTRGHDVPVSR